MATSLTQTAYQSIRNRMLLGDLQPGTRLVSRGLAKSIGMSFTPVREALSRLVSEGLVEQVPGGGAFVRTLSRAEVIQLYDLREAIECHAVAAAVDRIDDQHIEHLHEILANWRQLTQQVQAASPRASTHKLSLRAIELDIEFHSVLIDAAGNPWVSKIVGDLRLMARIADSKPRSLTAHGVAATHRQHVQLVRAIERRDKATCVELMRAHLRDGLKDALRGERVSRFA